MSSLLAGRRLLFRSVLLLFVGVVLVGVLLDRLLLHNEQVYEQQANLPWLTANFDLLEQRLAAQTHAGSLDVVSQFGQQFGLQAKVIALDDIAMPEKIQQRLGRGEIVELFMSSGRAQYYRRIQSGEHQQAVISLQENGAQDSDADAGGSWRWLSTVYYLSVLALLIWWLRPLLKDIENLNTAARRLGEDIHAETPELEQVSELKVLSATFSRMARQIRTMVTGQKEMTNALSHELRTPLARVKFGIAVLNEQVNDNVRTELGRINSDISEFDTLIGRMLDYARLDDPALYFQPQFIPVEPWLQSLCSKARSNEQGIETLLEIGDKATEVYADSTLLTLAVSNLYSNALRYARSSIRIRCKQNDNQWTLLVEDDGPGIPEEKLSEVFKAFTRLDESRDRGTGGHGLGLAVVARIAALHNGDVRAERSDIGGARFVFSMPADAASNSAYTQVPQ